ncbi:3-oxoacyl-ACP synthase III [Bythopirellula polymerisocia]|uniref:3-oxoacyl-[acyl-carrier-protein] synthase 3 n=1 Tax=Bythopirellula polymerisocia TaxID=2528003 RepID=A0A5C6CN97_9BACT|nr:3-oxoacyl-ACP synthase III [Bythopirellula polymerisocia]TWU25912.1 3-oxoacyl-[acyl-carrier-protein] synthase 3 [Bythopirellula polymerisocia]
MRYQRVCLESLGYTLPREVVTTDELEQQLAPVYERLRLPAGRLELMTGIRERRFFAPGTSPGSVSQQSGEQAILASGIDRHLIGGLVHGSVCRDFLEPATACSVHHALGLPAGCLICDVSNACLGILTGIIQLANMIELGQIKAGLVVGTESGRQLVENTVERLNADQSLTRQSIKQLVASLTIGSGSVAVLLCDESISRSQNRLTTASVLADTSHHQLCRSEGLETFMHTDSEQLMQQGVAAGTATFKKFLTETEWTHASIDKTICHQVGVAHRKLLFQSLGLDPNIDFSTFETLGNTGAAALPLTLALAAEAGHVASGDNVALMGIGSGINCQMLAVEWNETLVQGGGE